MKFDMENRFQIVFESSIPNPNLPSFIAPMFVGESKMRVKGSASWRDRIGLDDCSSVRLV